MPSSLTPHSTALGDTWHALLTLPPLVTRGMYDLLVDRCDALEKHEDDCPLTATEQLTPLQLSAWLGRKAMFRHILHKRTKLVWKWGPEAECAPYLPTSPHISPYLPISRVEVGAGGGVRARSRTISLTPACVPRGAFLAHCHIATWRPPHPTSRGDTRPVHSTPLPTWRALLTLLPVATRGRYMIPLNEIDSADSRGQRTVMELLVHPMAEEASHDFLLDDFLNGFLFEQCARTPRTPNATHAAPT